MSRADTPEPWLTKKQVAATLQVSVRTVERLKLPFTRVGGQNRYRMSEVETGWVARMGSATT